MRTDWYGYQSLIVDGASVALGLGVGAADAGTGVAVFTLGYTLGGPTVHWAHGQLGRGFASLGLRVGAPVVTTFVGAIVGLALSTESEREDDDVNGGLVVGAFVGALAGYVTAVVVDDVVLARESVSEPLQPATATAPPAAFTLAPSFTRLREGGMTAGVSGTF